MFSSSHTASLCECSFVGTQRDLVPKWKTTKGLDQIQYTTGVLINKASGLLGDGRLYEEEKMREGVLVSKKASQSRRRRRQARSSIHSFILSTYFDFSGFVNENRNTSLPLDKYPTNKRMLFRSLTTIGYIAKDDAEQIRRTHWSIGAADL